MKHTAFGVWLLGAAAVATAQPGEALSVAVAPMVRKEVATTLEVVGTVNPNTTSVLSPEIGGLIAEMPVRQGDRVARGQVICRLKDDTLKIELRGAQAELEAGTRPDELKRLRAAVEEARAEFARWEYEKQRISRLYEQNKASEKEYRDTLTAYTGAAKRLAQAEALLSLAEEGPRREVKLQARHAVAAQQAAIDRIENQIDKTILRAPFAGAVVRKMAEVGEWVQPGAGVCELVDLETVLVRVDVPESAIAFLRIGQEVSVRFDAIDGRRRAEVRHIIPRADPTARTFPVELEAPNADHTLLAGMFARAAVPASKPTQALLAPWDALTRDGNRTFVYVIREKGPMTMARRVDVEVLAERTDAVAVRGFGLRDGDSVVVTGNEMLVRIPAPELPVQILPDPPATGGPAATRPTTRSARAMK